MLVPLQTSGSRPPLFFVHGGQGIAFSVGTRFARSLGSDQPFFVINANGMDGRQPVIKDVHEMVVAYLHEIRQARPSGLIRIAGMCEGCLIAIEIARALQEEGRQTGPVMLLDPPVMPAGFEKRQNKINIGPELADRFYREVRGRFIEKMLDRDNREDLPFDPRDPKQMHSAASVAMHTAVAFDRYVPRPFPGSVEVIAAQNRALGYLHPEMPWHKLLCGPRVVHVVPWSHMELLRAGRKTVARLVKSMLEEDPGAASFGDVPKQPGTHPIKKARP